MHNELTQKDLQLMREELDYRRVQLRPKLLEAVKEARAFGDLSENFEYKAAKQEKNRNESRIRFLENMIKTAVVIADHSGADTVGLYDRVTVYLEEDDETEVYQIVTTMRQDALHGLVSKESPWERPCWAAGWGTGPMSRSMSSTATMWRSDPSKRGRTTAPSPQPILSGGRAGKGGARRKPCPQLFPAVYPHRWRSRLAMVK